MTYGLRSTGFPGLTQYYYQDGKLKKLLGSMGKVSFSAVAGEFLKAAFEFMGHDGGITDTPIITPNYDTTVPPIFISAGFNWAGEGSTNIALENFTLDTGVEISKPKDANQANGFGDLTILSRNITGTFDPLDVANSNINFYDQWEQGTTGVITFSIGNAAGNIITFTMPKAYIKEISEGDREGQRALEISFGAIEDAADDDELTIAFT